MKLKQLKSLFVIYSLVSFSIVVSVGSMGVSLNSENITNVVWNESYRVEVKSHPITIPIFNPLSIFGSYDSNETGVFVVANETQNESKPSIVTNNNNVLVSYEYEDENGTHVALRSSNDHGQTWPGFYDIGVNLFCPTITTKPSTNEGYGTLISSINDSGILYDLEFGSIGNLNTLSISYVDWSDLRNVNGHEDEKFWGFKDATIVYNKTNTRGKFIAVVIGSTDFEVDGEGKCTDCPMFFYRHPEEPESYILAWDPYIEHCRNLSAVMNYDTDKIYGVCEIQNGSNKDILFFNDNPTMWDEESPLVNQTIKSSENLTHPSILLNGDDIYITAESDTQGLILCHSSNDGKNWSGPIQINDYNGTSPVLYINETHLACFFVDSGNLNIKTTIDDGKNWSGPIQINDYNGTVDSAYRNFDLGNMDKIIWTDTRDGNKDLYYYLSYIPKVDLALTNFRILRDDVFPTFNWISITVTNLGDAPSSDIQVIITYTCEGEKATATNYPGYIQSIGAGEALTIKRPLFRFKSPEFFQSLIDFAGLRNITIYLDPETVTDDINPANNIYPAQPMSYEEIFPKLGRFEIIEKFFYGLKHGFRF